MKFKVYVNGKLGATCAEAAIAVAAAGCGGDVVVKYRGHVLKWPPLSEHPEGDFSSDHVGDVWQERAEWIEETYREWGETVDRWAIRKGVTLSPQKRRSIIKDHAVEWIRNYDNA